VYDHRPRKWRHLDACGWKVWIRYDIARVDCPRCQRVRTEAVPWARPDARLTREVEDEIAWLAQQMSKKRVAELMRCAWETVDAVVTRVVAEHRGRSHDRLNGLRRIGVDEISYRRGHAYLTIIADHDTGRVVWVAEDRTQQALSSFFVALGPKRSARLQAISCDASSIYLPVLRLLAPAARLCLDPFHVVKWCNEAMDLHYKSVPPLSPQQREKVSTEIYQRCVGLSPTRTWSAVRAALRRGAENLKEHQHSLLGVIRRHDRRVFRAWQLKEELRELYAHITPRDARTYLKKWLSRCRRSRIQEMVMLARRIDRHFEAVVAAVEEQVSNGRIEGINSKIRIIQRRGYGYPKPASLIAMIYLCLSGISILLPMKGR